MDNVEIMCKSTFKPLCIFSEFLCAKHKKSFFYVDFKAFPLSFSLLLTDFSTPLLPLKNYILFHFFTDPTITIINKLEERK